MDFIVSLFQSSKNKLMNTDNNSFAESLEKTARDMQYPPLNGGPTQEEIIKALSTAAEIIGEHECNEYENEENADRVEELESAIEDATDKIDDILINLSLAMNSGELPTRKTTEDIETTLMEIRSDLRRA